jgi:chromosomal replication initiation ATPase DnaA
MPGSFPINRIYLRKLLASFKVSDKSIDAIEENIRKLHNHINAVAFASLLERYGVDEDRIKIVFRDIGIDDVSIVNVFSIVDEQKIKATFGKVVDIDIN